MSMSRVTSYLFVLLCLGLGQATHGGNPVPLSAKVAAQSPYNCIGQLFFQVGEEDYIGSATIVGSRSVLTAGHNIYDAEYGWSSNYEFYRATHGSNVKPVARPVRRYLFAGYQSAVNKHGPDHIRSFAHDAGGLMFGTPFGRKVLVSGEQAYLGIDRYKTLVGYGAEGRHNGDYPLSVGTTGRFYTVYGKFAECYDVYVEGGMSGGPLFSQMANGTMVQVGVVVSGSTRPRSGGVRLLDPAMIRNLRTFLF